MADFRILQQKEIIMILIGGEPSTQTESLQHDVLNEPYMPYLSGSEICKISSKFGCYQSTSEKLPRKDYFENLLLHAFENNLSNDLLSYLFSIENFDKKLALLGAKERKITYEKLREKAIDLINGVLLSGKLELIDCGSSFALKQIDSSIKLETPQVSAFQTSRIQCLASRAFDDISKNNFDSALTKARTVLEEAFIHILDTNNIPFDNKNDIGGLFKKVKANLNMNIDRDLDKRIKSLISGLNTCVTSVAELRNNYGDAHANINKKYNIKAHHARLAVNASITVAEFLLSSSSEISRKSDSI